MGRGGKRVSKKLKRCVCSFCETKFTVCSVGQNPKYCSKECKAKARLANSGISLTCQNCGRQFVALYSKAKYCSNACYGQAKTKTEHYRTKHRKVCPVCEQEFETITRSQICCSPECGRKIGQEKLKKYYPCQHCGNLFWRPDAFRMKYCSIKCQKEALQQKTAERHKDDPPPVIYNRTCPECGLAFETRFPNHTYCSRKCSYAGNLRSQRMKLAAVYVPKSFICKECGIEITTTYGDVRTEFCCLSCANKFDRRLEHKTDRHKKYLRNLKKLRDEQLTKAFVENVDYDKIYKQSGGVCEICGLPVIYDKLADNNWSGTIDHIIPLSKGGKHALFNCQLAHRICNSLKNNSLDFAGIDWEEKSQKDNYWSKKYQQGLQVMGLEE
ncbi:MAG: HNH endonuclease signature motif containing protein [Kiritimatiellae bacterium]|nr:HNH endonuclease signature motif containing protein [Kiritimatiellia bacterium]